MRALLTVESGPSNDGLFENIIESSAAKSLKEALTINSSFDVLQAFVARQTLVTIKA